MGLFVMGVTAFCELDDLPRYLAPRATLYPTLLRFATNNCEVITYWQLPFHPAMH